GVASPRAQGHEMTRTAMPMESANSKEAPRSIQMMNAAAAMVMTAGTKMPAILSAILAIGALDEEASSTRRMIWLSVVFSPTRTAFPLRKPVLLIVAAI